MAPITNRNVPQRHKAIIYKLKREYGGSVTVYRQLSSGVDITTGERTTTRQTWDIDRVIILPVKITANAIRSISEISANKKFVYGGYFIQGLRSFFIDPRDLPNGFQFHEDDWFVYQGRKYEISEINDWEFDSVWHILVSEIVGIVPEQIHQLTGYNILDVSSEAGEGD